MTLDEIQWTAAAMGVDPALLKPSGDEGEARTMHDHDIPPPGKRLRCSATTRKGVQCKGRRTAPACARCSTEGGRGSRDSGHPAGLRRAGRSGAVGRIGASGSGRIAVGRTSNERPQDEPVSS